MAERKAASLAGPDGFSVPPLRRTNQTQSTPAHEPLTAKDDSQLMHGILPRTTIVVIPAENLSNPPFALGLLTLSPFVASEVIGTEFKPDVF
jgi:hypothetical protein